MLAIKWYITFIHYLFFSLLLNKGKKKVKADIALNDTPSQSYGIMGLAIWDHTVLPATRHK